MSKNINWSIVNERKNLDAGLYRMKISSLRELDLDEKNPVRTVLGAFEVEEPQDSAGEVHFERFRIGSEEDPLGDDENTIRRSMGVRTLKQLLRASASPTLEQDEATFEAARGNVFIGKIVKVPGRGQNEGQEYSNMRGYFSVNSQEAMRVGMAETTPAYTNGAQGTVAASGQKMTCPVCSEPVIRADYGKHLASHKSPAAQAAVK